MTSAGRLAALLLQSSPCGEFLDCGAGDGAGAGQQGGCAAHPATAAASGAGSASVAGSVHNQQESAVELLLKALMLKVKEAVVTKLSEAGMSGLNC